MTETKLREVVRDEKPGRRGEYDLETQITSLRSIKHRCLRKARD